MSVFPLRSTLILNFVFKIQPYVWSYKVVERRAIRRTYRQIEHNSDFIDNPTITVSDDNTSN